MKNKMLLIVALVLMTIVSLGAVSAADDVIDDLSSSDASEDVIAEDGGNPELSSTTLDIDNTMTNAEIQEKFDNLEDNTIINFAPGEYNDVQLKIDKQKTVEVDDVDEEGNPKLDDEGNPIKKIITEKITLNNIIINGNGATLTGHPPMSNYYDGVFEVANVNGFTLSGFNFICQGVTQANMKTPSCVIIFNTSNGIVENNNISGGRFGLYVGSKFTNPNYDTIVRYNTVTGVSDMGIISFGSARSHIYNNTIINPANHGIDVRHGSGPKCIVENNTIYGAREGIYLMHSGGHKAINNTLNFCDIGITCYGSNNIFCDGNKFLNNTKIGYLLASGYTNITIGEENDYSGLVFVPMPPTFTYNIVKANSDYVSMTNGTFSQTEATNTTYVQVYFAVGDEETLDPVDLKADTTNIITEELLKLNDNITVKIWRNDDNNHIDAGEYINVSIDGVECGGESDITGAVYVDITKLGEGKHYMTVKYPGYNGLKESTWSAVLQIGEDVPATREITSIDYNNMTTTAVDTKIDGRIGNFFTITLKDSTGKAIANKPVQIGFNGVVYDRVTDDKGKAKLQINLKAAGTYTFAVAFLGDDQYNGSFIVAKIVVNKQKGSLTVPAKSYKASATKTLTASFKTAAGNPVAGKKVTFTVNGKTYSATTNAKGVATVKVSLNKKGTYNFTAKSAGNNMYAAMNKTAKLTIK
jgi:parallel beta-helix repeat protein